MCPLRRRRPEKKSRATMEFQKKPEISLHGPKLVAVWRGLVSVVLVEVCHLGRGSKSLQLLAPLRACALPLFPLPPLLPPCLPFEV